MRLYNLLRIIIYTYIFILVPIQFFAYEITGFEKFNGCLMNSYQKEQFDAFSMVQKHLASLQDSDQRALKILVIDYLAFRSEVEVFLATHFSRLCNHRCYLSRRSACCSREGIITFFADIAINGLVSNSHEIDGLMEILKRPNTGFKCVYLTESGCRWRIKPIVCEMFLCDHAKQQVIGKNLLLKKEWELIEQKRKQFTWPDQPVVFDALEEHFLEAGYESPLMYLHNSPGLLRVKRKAGLL